MLDQSPRDVDLSKFGFWAKTCMFGAIAVVKGVGIIMGNAWAGYGCAKLLLAARLKTGNYAPL